MSILNPLLDGPLVDVLDGSLLLLPLLLGLLGDEDEPDAAAEVDPPVVDSPDHELVRAVLDGDATAYKGLVERYQGRIYNVIYGMVRNREDAWDLTQDAFVKAYKNLSRFRFGSSFYTWICRIGMNVAIDHLRNRRSARRRVR